jgi:hypothetical protein
VRAVLVQIFPSMHAVVILTRAIVLCAVGTGIYLVLAQLLGIRELSNLQRLLLRRLKFQRLAPG